MAERSTGVQPVGESSVRVRVLGAVLFGLVFLGTLVWGSLPFTFGVALAAVAGSMELFSLFETRGQAVPAAAVVGIAGCLAYVFLAHYRPIESFGYVTAGLLFLCFFWYLAVRKHVKPTRAVALTVLAPLVTGFCLCHLVLIRDQVDALSGTKNKGWWIVLFLIVLIWVYDILAWAVGRKIGRHKMSPGISPKKSWEGTVAGTIGALAASAVLRLIIQTVLGGGRFTWFSNGVALIIGVIVVVLGPIGDFSESMMKRDYGVKDMGRLIPGHGGIMDRFDSTIFTAPAVFYYLYYFVLR